jgi:hypothetical protein
VGHEACAHDPALSMTFLARSPAAGAPGGMRGGGEPERSTRGALQRGRNWARAAPSRRGHRCGDRYPLWHVVHAHGPFVFAGQVSSDRMGSRHAGVIYLVWRDRRRSARGCHRATRSNAQCASPFTERRRDLSNSVLATGIVPDLRRIAREHAFGDVSNAETLRGSGVAPRMLTHNPPRATPRRGEKSPRCRRRRHPTSRAARNDLVKEEPMKDRAAPERGRARAIRGYTSTENHSIQPFEL